MVSTIDDYLKYFPKETRKNRHYFSNRFSYKVKLELLPLLLSFRSSALWIQQTETENNFLFFEVETSVFALLSFLAEWTVNFVVWFMFSY